MSDITVSAYGDCLATTYERACYDCRWWTVAEYEHGPATELTCGYCRRFPPYCENIDTADDGHGQKLLGHPLCYAGDDICGEFAPRGW